MAGECRIYVAAPLADAPLVRDVHAQLRAHGLVPVSHWAERQGDDPNDNFDDAEEVQAKLRLNDAGVAAADVFLVLAREGAGGEMFCEAARALALGAPVIWVGRRVLSTFREGVRYFHSRESAVHFILTWKDELRREYRGAQASSDDEKDAVQ